MDDAAAAEGGGLRYMEHRWGRRVRCHAQVRVTGGAGQAGTGRLRDVSMSGTCVEASLVLPLFAPVALTVPRGKGMEVVMRGTVTRTDERGFGVEWLEASPGAICPVLGCRTHCEAAAHWK
jgi:hypothetical protein